jgi:hypothetical protein
VSPLSLSACFICRCSWRRTDAAAFAFAASITAPSPGPGRHVVANADPFPSTYKPFSRRTTLIRNATIMTAAADDDECVVPCADGKIAAVGPRSMLRLMLW